MVHDAMSRGVKVDNHGLHTCPICGKKFPILSLNNWTFKKSVYNEPWYFCGNTCWSTFLRKIDAERKAAAEKRKAECAEKRQVKVAKASELKPDTKVILWTPWIARKLGIEDGTKDGRLHDE